MALCDKSVIVRKLPEIADKKLTRAFLRDLGPALEAGRPQIVLDCTALRSAGHGTMFLLLNCLEEAMKHRGDVKLAAAPGSVRASFEAAGLNRLFEIFDTEADAVNSFQRKSAGYATQRLAGNGGSSAAEHPHTSAVPYPPLLVVKMIRSEQ